MKKTFLLILTFSIFPLLNSCGTKYSTAEMESNFTETEIEDLKQIRDFFIQSVCGNKDFENCYKKTNHDSLMLQGNEFWEKIDFVEQKKLYERISKTTFDKIWMYYESTYFPSKTKSQDICLATLGKYQNYLIDLGKRNPSIAKYADNIQASGAFSQFYIQYQEILKPNSDFDLNDPNIQLILAIHYLSLNDGMKRNAHLIERNEPIKFQ
ncbi:hypothetical protein [Flavobacterium sp.]|uniref:hypothetical protein n=1 Tax=Flavobacterium sp. TaxID=239 RepID=UPI0040477ECD